MGSNYDIASLRRYQEYLKQMKNNGKNRNPNFEDFLKRITPRPTSVPPVTRADTWNDYDSNWMAHTPWLTLNPRKAQFHLVTHSPTVKPSYAEVGKVKHGIIALVASFAVIFVIVLLAIIKAGCSSRRRGPSARQELGVQDPSMSSAGTRTLPQTSQQHPVNEVGIRGYLFIRVRRVLCITLNPYRRMERPDSPPSYDAESAAPPSYDSLDQVTPGQSVPGLDSVVDTSESPPPYTEHC